MAVTLNSLIEDVEHEVPSRAPLDLLVAAASTAQEVTDSADALLTHFVDRTRQAGHSWTEIGAALSVTKQAVQKRFTAEQREPRGLERFTTMAHNVVTTHAHAVADELEHNYIGTEHLLAGFWGEPGSLAVEVLTRATLTREAVLSDIEARVPRGHVGRGGFTPRAWIAIENAARIAARAELTHVGTEHVLLSMLSGVGGLADDILSSRGVSGEMISSLVTEVIGVGPGAHR